MISRRGFLGMLAGLAVEPVAKKVFVFAPPQGWKLSNRLYILNPRMSFKLENIQVPDPFEGGDEMQIPLQYVVPCLSDNIFKPGPLMGMLRGNGYDE